MDRWLNVGVKGRAVWPTKETTIEFGGRRLVLKPATRETDQSVHINLRGISDVEALTLINRFLSVLSWCDDQSMDNQYGWSGNPVPVAVPRESRAVGSSIAFPFQRKLEADEKARLALALFREGRTVNSIPFAFLSYFKILNMFWNDRFVTVNSQRENPLVEESERPYQSSRTTERCAGFGPSPPPNLMCRDISMSQAAALSPTRMRTPSLTQTMCQTYAVFRRMCISSRQSPST
jgi:hypothetical protein